MAGGVHCSRGRCDWSTDRELPETSAGNLGHPLPEPCDRAILPHGSGRGGTAAAWQRPRRHGRRMRR